MIVLFDKESIKVEVEERQVVIVASAMVADKWRWFNCILDWEKIFPDEDGEGWLRGFKGLGKEWYCDVA